MKTRGKPVNTSAIPVAALEQWMAQEASRWDAIKCQALIALTKNICVTSVK
ncbi:MAG: hypothetical protein V1781_08700 [Bacteroidota bacterium]